jgi:hypothetical protein
LPMELPGNVRLEISYSYLSWSIARSGQSNLQATEEVLQGK